MADSVHIQKLRVQSLIDQGNFPAMYRYIARQIGTATNDAFLMSMWLHSAEKINQPGSPNQNILKQLVWLNNDAASRQYLGVVVSDAKNQQVSDSLARLVGGDYIAYLDGLRPFTPQSLFDRDVNSAVLGLGLPQHAWSGGLLGVAYGFDVLAFGADTTGIFKNQAQIDAWYSTMVGVLEDNTGALLLAAAKDPVARGLMAFAFERALSSPALSDDLKARIRLLALETLGEIPEDILDLLNVFSALDPSLVKPSIDFPGGAQEAVFRYASSVPQAGGYRFVQQLASVTLDPEPPTFSSIGGWLENSRTGTRIWVSRSHREAPDGTVTDSATTVTTQSIGVDGTVTQTVTLADLVSFSGSAVGSAFGPAKSGDTILI